MFNARMQHSCGGQTPLLRADAESSNWRGLTRPRAHKVHSHSPWTWILPPVRTCTAQSLDNVQDRTHDLNNIFECPEPKWVRHELKDIVVKKEQTTIYKHTIHVSIALSNCKARVKLSSKVEEHQFLRFWLSQNGSHVGILLKRAWA